MEWIRHIACPIESDDLFATAEFERKVTVWSLKQRRKLAEFNTGLDAGGRRLSLIDGDRPLVIAGAYHRHGLCAYTLDGALLWQRKDFKRVQHVESSAAYRLVSAGLDSRALQIVNADTRKTVRAFRGAEEGYFGPNCDELLVTGRSCRARTVSLSRGRTIAVLPSSKVTIHTAQSNDGILLTGFAEGVHEHDDGKYTYTCIRPAYIVCYGRKGNVLWQAEAPQGAHFLRVVWCETHQRWYAVQWQFTTGGPYVVNGFDPNGVLQTQGEIEHVWECEFLAGGTMVAASAGQVLSLPDLQLVWQFADPPPPPKR